MRVKIRVDDVAGELVDRLCGKHLAPCRIGDGHILAILHLKAREVDPNDTTANTEEAVTGDNVQDTTSSPLLGILLGIGGVVAATAVVAIVLVVKKRTSHSRRI